MNVMEYRYILVGKKRVPNLIFPEYTAREIKATLDKAESMAKEYLKENPEFSEVVIANVVTRVS
ncbi:unnamed protein product [marine sediment metagenome]|uniref:Uncharacterized protein n=1 Tax=marine sediment metagenome TaxID=412755 RepID=X1EHM6_9ZZZZ